MVDNVSGGLPNPGKTYHGGTPTSIGRSVEIEGTEKAFRDEIKVGNEPRRKRSGKFRYARLVRNTSGMALTPGRLVTWESGFRNRRVDGYARTTGVEVAGVVDPDLPVSGVADDDLFWCFFKGPCDVKTALAANAYAEGEVVGALTAVTSGAVTAGRPTVVNTATTATLPSVILNRIGRVMTARTTANTDVDMLVDLSIEP